jgi:diacylglycerol kinase family enzyme
LRANRFRSIGLGRADDRYFTFCAGLGLDAEIISRVENARYRGDTPSPWLYARTLTKHYAVRTQRGNRPITLERPGEEPIPDIASVVVQNTNPSTYLGRRRIDVCPRASFDSGLDVAALRGLRVPGTVRFFAELMLGRARAGQPVGPTGRNVLHLHDVAEFILTTTEPIGFQLDGDYLGPREKVRFTAIPHALRVFC